LLAGFSGRETWALVLRIPHSLTQLLFVPRKEGAAEVQTEQSEESLGKQYRDSSRLCSSAIHGGLMEYSNSGVNEA
jgi:hypothetical protein